MIAWLKKYNIATRLLSILIAILMWFFVVSQLNPDMDSTFRNIDVQITDIEQLTGNGLAIVSGGNATATVKVRGKRDKIALLEADSFKITASVGAITVPGTYNLSYNIEVPDASVVTKKPSQISVVIDHISSKTIPAVINFSGKMQTNYLLDDYSLSPNAIVVKGPQSMLGNIDKAVLSYNVTGLTKSGETTLSYTLVDKEGDAVDMTAFTVDTPAIVLKTDVKLQKTIPLTVNFISDGVFSESIIKWDIQPSGITVIGDPSVVSDLNKINLGTVNLKTIITSRAETLAYSVNLPNGLSAVTPVDSAVLNITTPGYGFKSIVVSSELFEPAEGYKYLFGSGITVDVFGSTKLLENLDAEDFTVKPIRVSESHEGVTGIAALSVTCRYSDATILGVYTVPVTVDSAVTDDPAE